MCYRGILAGSCSQIRWHLRRVQKVTIPQSFLGLKLQVGGACGSGMKESGDLVSRLITPVTRIVTPFTPTINLLTKSP